MSTIKNFIEKIKSARYGKDVRQSIIDAIEQTYDDAIANGHTDMEVAKARDTYNDLNSRLEADKNKIEEIIENEENDRKSALENIQNKVKSLASGNPLVASNTSEMTDKSRVYVNTSDGHWYYFNKNWKDGGVYQSTIIENDYIKLNMLEDKLQQLFVPKYKEMTLNYNLNGYYTRNESTELETSSTQTTCKVEVSEGEVYKFDGYVLGNMRCIIAIDENNNYLGTTDNYMVPELNTFPNPKEHMQFEFLVPKNCRYLYVLNYSDQFPTKFYKLDNYNLNLSKTNQDIENLKFDIENLKFDIENLKIFNANEQLKNDFKWDGNITNNKYATFTFDDSNSDIDLIENLFEKKGVPCCFATIPNKLNNICTNGETVKQVLERAVANGGEVLSHWHKQLNSLSTSEDYIDVYINSKKILKEAGFEANGIITAGGGTDGTPQSYKTQDFEKDIIIARNNYLYADLTATEHETIEQYYNKRNFLDSGFDSIKNLIDNYIAGTSIQPYSKWLNFASHGTNTNNIEEFEKVIDYCLSNNVQIVTWNYLYTHFASSVLKEKIKALEN